jgi:hypothetical protein
LETRQAELLMQLYDRYNDTEFRKAYNKVLYTQWADYDDFNAKYGPESDVRIALETINAFFEGVGVLVKRGLLDILYVEDLLLWH